MTLMMTMTSVSTDVAELDDVNCSQRFLRSADNSIIIIIIIIIIT